MKTKTRTLIRAFAIIGLWLPMADGCHKQAIAAEQQAEKTKPYSLNKCVVSEEKFGEHGKP